MTAVHLGTCGHLLCLENHGYCKRRGEPGEVDQRVMIGIIIGEKMRIVDKPLHA